MIVTPYYNKPTQAGVLTTSSELIADSVDLPVILYDIPGRTGIPIKYETIIRAAKHPNILAVKDAKGDFAEVSRVLNETDLLYFSGDDSNILPHLALGAVGLIGVTANISAAPYRTIVDAVNANDLATAQIAFQAVEPLVRGVMSRVPGTVAAKYILHGLGRIGSPRVRLPLVGPEEAKLPSSRPISHRSGPARASTSPTSVQTPMPQPAVRCRRQRGTRGDSKGSITHAQHTHHQIHETRWRARRCGHRVLPRGLRRRTRHRRRPDRYLAAAACTGDGRRAAAGARDGRRLERY